MIMTKEKEVDPIIEVEAIQEIEVMIIRIIIQEIEEEEVLIEISVIQEVIRVQKVEVGALVEV
jgi:hypothetical protein